MACLSVVPPALVVPSKSGVTLEWAFLLSLHSNFDGLYSVNSHPTILVVGMVSVGSDRPWGI